MSIADIATVNEIRKGLSLVPFPVQEADYLTPLKFFRWLSEHEEVANRISYFFTSGIWKASENTNPFLIDLGGR